MIGAPVVAQSIPGVDAKGRSAGDRQRLLRSHITQVVVPELFEQIHRERAEVWRGQRGDLDQQVVEGALDCPANVAIDALRRTRSVVSSDPTYFAPVVEDRFPSFVMSEEASRVHAIENGSCVLSLVPIEEISCLAKEVCEAFRCGRAQIRE
jgi:hypothetical protein